MCWPAKLRRPAVDRWTTARWASWPFLVIVAALAVVLSVVRIFDVPLQVNASMAAAGLQARMQASGVAQGLAAPGVAGLPLLATAPTALFRLVTGDGLLAGRLSGIYGGLLVVIATWLLAGELFYRRVRVGSYGVVIEDDGRWLMVVAAAVVAGSVPFYQFSREPIWLEAVAWAA